MPSITVLPRLSIRGLTAALVFLSLICGRAAPPAPVAPPADIANQLQGTWHFHWTETGFNADFLFKPDGTFTDVGVARVGTWKVAGNKIVMTPQGWKKHLEMFLPIDPKGTTAHDDRNRKGWIIAVKKETPAPGVAPPQIAITPTTPAVPANPAPVAVPAPSLVNLSPEQVSTAKKATAIIVRPASVVRPACSATAFCISESGVFVTCDHVLESVKAGSLAIIIDPKGKNEKRYPAKVLHERTSGLAVVKVELDQKVPALKLADVSTLREGQPIFAFGYPLGDRLVDAKSYPAITVNFGRITSLRKEIYVKATIVLDGHFPPGNCGGPALNEKGEVVGVLANGMNSAIPVSHLFPSLPPAIISVEAPKLVFEKRFDPVEFAISVDWLQPQAAEPKVAIEISSEGSKRDAAAKRGADGKYHVSLAPLVKEPAPATNKLGVTVDLEKGQMTGIVEDFVLTVNGERRPLSKITSIVRTPGSGTFTVDGKPAGALPELAKLNIDTGPAVVTVDAQKATRIQIVVPSEEVARFSYKAVVTTAAGKTFSSEARRLTLDPAQPREFPLPSPAYDVVAGAGGRILVLHLWEIQKLAIFDVVDLKIRGFIDLTAEPVLIAAGLRHILVVYRDQNIMQRYSAETLALERTITNPFTEELTNLEMGYSSPRIAVVRAPDAGMRAFDTETMGVTGSSRGIMRIDETLIRASADGRTYGCHRTGISPSGFNIVSFRNGELSLFTRNESPLMLLPNADGSVIFTNSGVYTPKDVPVLKNTDRSGGLSFFPSYHPGYFFAVRWSWNTKEPPKPVAIYMRGSDQPLVYLPKAFAEMSGEEARWHEDRSERITMDKRYHFYPQLNLFLTIPPTNDRIVAHPVNVRQVLIEKGIDYLYVTSTAPEARVGTVYHYHLEAESKAGGIKFSLRSGPAGLTVSADGNVAWTVPAKATDESVIVSVKDASGREILHTFPIAITN